MARKILIVDDSKTLRQQVRIALEGPGYQVLEAEDGTEGLSQLRGQQDIALVICDINMPRMNGLEMLEQLKVDPSIGKVPVVMLTTEGQPDLIRRASAAGARGWIVKPFKQDLLLGAVKKLAGPPESCQP